ISSLLTFLSAPLFLRGFNCQFVIVKTLPTRHNSPLRFILTPFPTSLRSHIMRLLRIFQLSSLLTIAILCLVAADTQPTPPVAKKVPHVTEINGRKLVDNYFWLRDKPNPDVRAYLEAENAYTDAVMQPTEPLQKKLYEEMLGRIKETDVDVPYLQDGYWYYTRTEAGKQYAIRCRKKGSLDAPEQVVIDVNQLAQGRKFMSLDEFQPSDDG